MKKFALIVAGGSGSRMETEIPKQFIPVNGTPIIMHTIKKFYAYNNNISIIVVLPKNQFIYWNELCKKYNFSIPLQLIEGGNSRFQSVKNGLSTINKDGVVAIHDGVRPFVSKKIIKENYTVATEFGSALTVVNLKDSIRLENENNSKSLNRTDYRLVQTPQTFTTLLIKEAYNQSETSFFTDDASVYEANGGKISLVEGDYRNIKITTPEDLIIAEIYSKS